MNAFFYYFGAKHKIAHLYGPPQLNITVEVCGGSVGWSIRWNSPKTIIVEINPWLCDVWKFLIDATPDMIRDIPIVTNTDDIPDSFPQAVRDWIGLTWETGRGTPKKEMPKAIKRMAEEKQNNWHRKAWGEIKREVCARNVMKLKNWEVINGDFSMAPDIRAHYHIDPPYQILGTKSYEYKFNDYPRLAEFAMSRKGIVDVCESRGADWMEFVGLRSNKNQNGNLYEEVVCRIRDGVVNNSEFQMDNQLNLFDCV